MEKKKPSFKTSSRMLYRKQHEKWKGLEPREKKNKKEKRREVRKEESVGRKVNDKKKIWQKGHLHRKHCRDATIDIRLEKKKSNGASRTRKWPRQISTKKKGRGLTGNYLGWLRHSLHNIGCDSPKKKNFVRPYSVVCQIPLRRCYHCWSTAARPIRQQKGMLK